MNEDDGDIAVSHWVCLATPDTIARTTAAVGGFAGSHGMLDPVLARMTGAVTEALAEVFDTGRDLIGAGNATAVDAATDGLCLTVRLRGPGRWPTDSTSGRLSSLADRVELDFDERCDAMTVLLEFPADRQDWRDDLRGGDRSGGLPARATANDRSRPSQTSTMRARRGSHARSGPRGPGEINHVAARRARCGSRPARG